MSRHRSVAQDLSLLCTFDVWPPVPSLSLSRIHTHAHSLSLSVRMSVCTSLFFTLPVALDCLYSWLHLCFCSPCLSLCSVSTPDSLPVLGFIECPEARSPCLAVGRWSLSLSYSQSRSLSLFARLPFIVSLSLFLSQDFLSGLMCAGTSCPISPRARWATKDFLSGLTCAGASCPISPRARWATKDFPNAPHALRRVVQICLIFIF